MRHQPLVEAAGHQLDVILMPGPVYLDADPVPPGAGAVEPVEQRGQVHGPAAARSA